MEKALISPGGQLMDYNWWLFCGSSAEEELL